MNTGSKNIVANVVNGGPGSGVAGHTTGHTEGPWSREHSIGNPLSHAHRGRAPRDDVRELKSVHHITSTQAALKILGSKQGVIPVHSVSPELAQEAYGHTSDGGDYIYSGLSKEAAGNHAVGDGVRFQLNLEPHKKNVVVQPDQEDGLVMHHGPIPREAVTGVFPDNPSSPEGKKVLAAWAAYKAGVK